MTSTPLAKERTLHAVVETPKPSASPLPSPSPSPVLPTPNPVNTSGNPFTPISLSISAAAVTNAPVYSYTDAMVAATPGYEIVPSTLENVAWWSGGGHPGATWSNTTPPANSNDKRFTTFLYGHSWCDPKLNPSYCKPSVFDYLRYLTVGDGVTAIVTTSDGTQYVYSLTQTITELKSVAFKDPRVTNDSVGVLVTLTCDRPENHPIYEPTKDNFVAIWHLSNVIPPVAG
jgi:hypothetical protein